jgi:hypothetical protein
MFEPQTDRAIVDDRGFLRVRAHQERRRRTDFDRVLMRGLS